MKTNNQLVTQAATPAINHPMAHFQVLRTRRVAYLIWLDPSRYDYVWGFYNPLKTLEMCDE